jgi:hypothetical protein
MAAVTIDTTVNVTATPTVAEQHNAPISTGLAVTATPAVSILRTVNLSTGLTVTATGTPVMNQHMSIGTALKVTASPKTALYPQVEFFVVTSDLNAFVVDFIDPGTDPDIQPVSCTVTFTPRLGKGQVIWIPGQGVILAPIVARFDVDGILKTIQGDIGVKLVANTPVLGLDQLIWDVAFSNITYNKADQYIRPFAFPAPNAGGVTIDLATVTKLAPAPQ